MPGVDSIVIEVGDNDSRLQEWDVTTLPAQSGMDGGRVYVSIGDSGTSIKLYSAFSRAAGTCIASATSLSTSAASRVTLTAANSSGFAGTVYWYPQNHATNDTNIEVWLLPCEDGDLTQTESQITNLYLSGETSFTSFLRETMRDLIRLLDRFHEGLFEQTENGFFDLTKLHNPEAYRRWAIYRTLAHVYRHHNSVSREDFYLARAAYYDELAEREFRAVRPRVDTGRDREPEGRLLTQTEVLPG